MNLDKQLTAMIVPFYLGEQPDRSGRQIQEIWEWDLEKLECVHDYIQWLFPLPERSAFNSSAPIVDAATIQSFQSDPRLQNNLRKSLTVMLKLYGLQRHENSEGKIVIDKSTDYPNRKPEWVCMFDHNYLRITRILKCLMKFGLQEEAQAFYECLQQVYQENPILIGGTTFQYWKNAVSTTSLHRRRRSRTQAVD
jgi:Opioid growth factor receptor (OGFr) conserved region